MKKTRESQEAKYVISAKSIRLRERGQITIPRSVREDLDLNEGDILNWVQIGDALVLSTRTLQVPGLADRIADLMDAEGVSLADLLSGLKEERESIWREKRGDA